MRVHTIIFTLFLLINLIFAVDYSTEIQPIFNASCTNCHSTTSSSYSNHQLDLTSYSGLMFGGESGDVVVPGDSNSSILWQEVESGSMPSGATTPDLPSSVVVLIAEWINEGALEEEDPCATAGGDDDMDEICGDDDDCFGDNDTGDSDMDGVCDDVDDCLGQFAMGTYYDMDLDTGEWVFYQDDYDGDGVCDDGTDPCFGEVGLTTIWTVDPLSDEYTIEFQDSDMDGVCDDIDPCEGEYGENTYYEYDEETGELIFDESDLDGDGYCDDEEDDDFPECMTDCDGFYYFGNQSDYCNWLVAIEDSECFSDCDAYIMEEINLSVVECEDCLSDSSCDEVEECISEGENYCESGTFSTEESCDAESICAWGNGQCWYDCDPACEACEELSNEIIVEIPGEYGISKIYPNPFNPITVVEFTVPEISYISLDIYNINGNKVKELSSKLYSPGTHSIIWDASLYSSGVYFIRMNLGEHQFIKKVMLVK